VSWRQFAPKEHTKAHRFFAFWVLAERGIPFKTEVYVTVDGYTFKVDTLVTPNAVVEHDGESHLRERRKEKDEWKDDLLTKAGYEVFRIPDSEVWDNYDEWADRIEAFLEMET